MKRPLINTLKGVSILAIAGFLSKILAALYRFPYQNLVGDQGFYAFQQVYPFYSIITTLSLVALPNFLSSLVHSSDTPEEDTRQFFQLTFIFSIVTCLILTLSSQLIARLMGQEKLTGPFVMAIFPLLLVPFLSLYRGQLQAQNQMSKTALSQVIEQVVRVCLIIVAATLFTRLSNNIYTISFLAMLGSFIGGGIALIYLIVTTPFKMKSLFSNFFTISSKLNVMKKFGIPSLVFTFFMVYMLLLQMIDVFFVKNALLDMTQSITSTQAEVLKGIYDRGQPFLQLGLVITTSILTDALPNLTRRGKVSNQIWQNVTYLSITITTGLFLLLPSMNDVLFKSHEHSFSLQLFILQIPLISMIQLHHHALFLAHKNKKSGLFLISGLLLKLMLVYPLTSSLGLIGASLSSLISLIFVYLLYMIYSKKMPDALLNARFWLAIIAMSFVILIGTHIFIVENRILQLIKIVLITMMSSAVFLKVSRFKIKTLLT